MSSFETVTYMLPWQKARGNTRAISGKNERVLPTGLKGKSSNLGSTELLSNLTIKKICDFSGNWGLKK